MVNNVLSLEKFKEIIKLHENAKKNGNLKIFFARNGFRIYTKSLLFDGFKEEDINKFKTEFTKIISEIIKELNKNNKIELTNEESKINLVKKYIFTEDIINSFFLSKNSLINVFEDINYKIITFNDTNFKCVNLNISSFDVEMNTNNDKDIKFMITIQDIKRIRDKLDKILEDFEK